MSIAPHLLTCPERAASCAATLARWDRTDWGERPRLHLDAPPPVSCAVPASFQGMQAILLRRAALPRILAAWEKMDGLPSQRLAPLLGSESPLWVHRPSLVQHVATDSSWGARIYQALDFEPPTLLPAGTPPPPHSHPGARLSA